MAPLGRKKKKKNAIVYLFVRKSIAHSCHTFSQIVCIDLSVSIVVKSRERLEDGVLRVCIC